MKKILCTVCVMLLSVSATQAQKKKENETSSVQIKKDSKENLLVKLQEGAKPVIYVDGKVFDFPMELIDQSKIASIMVVKKQEALKKYNAPDGVILIKTKSSETVDFSKYKIKKENRISDLKNPPKIIIDGKVADKKTLDKLEAYQIDKMEVVKGEKALKKYNAPNGVILITTKKM